MHPDQIAERYAFAQEITAQAAVHASNYFARLADLEITSKGPQDVVSEADTAIEKILRAQVAERFPDDAFVGEEGGHTPGTTGGTWIVDPIDGTQPFTLGFPTWCVSVGFAVGTTPHFGVIEAPALAETYRGGPAFGAWLNDTAISVRTAQSLGEGLTALGCSLRTPPNDAGSMLTALMDEGGMFHRNGSGTLSLCSVAAGRLLGYVEWHINAWDCAGALAILHAAGGVSNDFLDNFGVAGGGPLVATSPALYSALESILPESARSMYNEPTHN